MRRLQWSEEKAFKGYTCSECGWLVPNPKLDFENRSKEQLREKAERTSSRTTVRSTREVQVRRDIADSITEDARRLDEISYQVGDVLDVRASIILVALTFFRGLSGGILTVSTYPRL